jgi:uncharacterized protein YndB with AHSA1/START domain
MQGDVTVHMDAPAERVWDLVTDVTRIGEFSPETFEAQWINGATGPAIGARFKGHVKRNQKGPVYWTECEVVVLEPNKEFAFAVLTRGQPLNTWGYRLAPAGGGTDVTEYFRLKNNVWLRLYWFLLGWTRGKTNERGMRTTLERMKAVVETQPA